MIGYAFLRAGGFRFAASPPERFRIPTCDTLTSTGSLRMSYLRSASAELEAGTLECKLRRSSDLMVKMVKNTEGGPRRTATLVRQSPVRVSDPGFFMLSFWRCGIFCGLQGQALKVNGADCGYRN